MTRLDPATLCEVVADQPYPLLFATVSGAHLYGFPSRDSDVDLRGAHLLPAVEVVGLRQGPATLDRSWTRHGVEIDLVTHDAAKFARMLLQRNGYVLEQLLSPLVVLTGEAHAELVALAPGCLTRHHAHHYLGFAQTQRRLHDRTGELKPLLYTFRTLLTGIHLMRTGRLVAHLPTLAAELAEAPAYLGTLVAAKAAGEHDRLAGVPDAPGVDRLGTDLVALESVLDHARQASRLPERPTAEPALHDLLVRIRLAAVPGR
ncbi:nucleotidyltransferase domain-containing protein [Micromonospora sp. WMMD1102]|uniref:nucleotidyltransferase domain-containing protein n=1 Tax=Micromonospora sp. WMMD1102 TaxID=3016105 RepID=UPI0024150961|nr:nucleotidyltransferase domain-containing protein [Micromonospora sp. WMMD1102]MDG4786306.1 nucleotidyltransferase domain-containing protein [Micromonospora sp. WMMD1102]